MSLTNPHQSQGESSRQFTTDEITPIPPDEESEVPRGTLNVATLSKHLRSLEKQHQKDQRDTQATLQAILAKLTNQALVEVQATAGLEPPPLHPSIENGNDRQRSATPASTTASSTVKSTKLPDPQQLSDGLDPTFENWVIQVVGKLEVNSDHYPSAHAQMLYVFGRTSGDAQKHLQARYRVGAINRFQTAQGMIDHLASIYTNPNREREAKYLYNRLQMKSSESFVEFQTKFLHLAGEGNIATGNLRDDLYDKLTVRLQIAIAPVLPDLDSYLILSRRCISLDAELNRIDQRNNRVLHAREKNALSSEIKIKAGKSTGIIPTASTMSSPLIQTHPEKSRRSESVDPAKINCFNCGEKGHYANDCPKPKKLLEVKDIEEEESSGSSGNEHP